MTTSTTVSRNAQPSTNLHDIRGFLSRHGHGAQPWNSSGEALDQLVRLLQGRAQDEVFWNDLSKLVRRLEDRRVSPALFSTHDVVSPEAADALVTAIRTALGPPETRHSNRTAYARGCQTASSMAGFLLLGMAVACGEDEKGETEGDPTTEDCAEATEHGIEGNSAEVFCELVEMIETADLYDDVRESLMDCLPDMSEAEWADMLSDWSNMSDGAVEEEMRALSYSTCDTRVDDAH